MNVRGDTANHVCVFYDPGLAGESATQPEYRVCALRNAHLKTVVRSFLVASGSPEALRDGDVFIFMDCGKHGNQGALTGSLKNTEGKRIPVHASCPWALNIFYKEKADKALNRGFMCERSTETALCVANHLPTMKQQANKHSPGTSRSDSIGPFPATGDSAFRMTYKQKKLLYAKDARVLPGAGTFGNYPSATLPRSWSP